MKQCPKCGNSYTDDTLRFCLEDGTPLNVADEQPTVFRGSDPHKTEQLPANVTRDGQAGIRVDIPTTQQRAAQPTVQTQTQSKSSPVLKIVLAIVALGFLAILGAGVLGGVFYYYSGRQVAVSTSPTPTATPLSLPTSTPDDGEKGLEDEIAKLKKQLEDSTGSDDGSDGDDNPSWGQKATVNSPSDGFLALRNLPSADIGERIAKIPHGTTISILICSEQSTTIAGRSGHWCMTTYDGQTGWVFDVWLNFANSKS